MRYAIYTRLSKSDDDRAVSLAQQAEACQRYVEAQGGTVDSSVLAEDSPEFVALDTGPVRAPPEARSVPSRR